MGDIMIGTCSWTDPALVSSGWYPSGRRDAEGRLRHYADRFPLVEVDSTYYGMPSVRNSRLWAERTPDGFRFDVKAFSLLTGHPTRPAAVPADLRPALARHGRARGAPADPGLLDEVWTRFAAALGPLREAGRLGAVLFQLPPWAAPGPDARTFLEECRRRTAGWRVAVEFRHPGWWGEDERTRTAALLGGLDLAAVAVDTARGLPGALTPDVPVTDPALSVVRFHGRSPAWGTGTKEDRFRHDYTADELREWAPRVRALADRAAEVHVLFNNCCGDAAVRAAEAMRRVLGAEGTEETPRTGTHGGSPAGQTDPHTIGPDRRDTPSASGTGTQEVSCRN
ncbi:DUF72 domain-containing protein [Streptomyces sudanensis]|uniref:DUF72 domain-containing protein n=1 Tax=Streptomyces sudanensis TaxID=436397 RepID=UPI0020CE1F88|nr:DUF72 domain-containing protein [Streptomyces sudanensis]MCP9959992.1 DUF72 domain-containing protein [Streptomyces sudanensis]MCP9999603.1 DUF72 domain-containing protein [Streptomyces sudanensis]